MESVERFSSATTRYVGLATMAAVVAALAVIAVEGQWGDLLEYAGPLGLVALVGLAAMWRPYVEVTDGGIEMRNVVRTVKVPWPAVQEIDGRYGLRLMTPYGRVSAWAAPAPAGRERLRGGDSEASAVVRRRHERLQALGHLDGARLERDHLEVTWHVEVIAAAVALTVLTVVMAFVG